MIIFRRRVGYTLGIACKGVACRCVALEGSRAVFDSPSLIADCDGVIGEVVGEREGIIITCKRYLGRAEDFLRQGNHAVLNAYAVNEVARGDEPAFEPADRSHNFSVDGVSGGGLIYRPTFALVGVGVVDELLKSPLLGEVAQEHVAARIGVGGARAGIADT